MRSRPAILTVFLLAGCAAQGVPPQALTRTAAAPPSVRLPQPGTEWVYEGWVSNRPQTRHRQLVRVVDASAERIVETHRLPDGRAFEATHGPGAYVAGRGAPGVFAFAPYLPAFESLAQGDVWHGVPFRGLGPCNGNPDWTCTFDAVVAGAERIRVAAGEFDVLRVEIDQKVTVSKPTGRFRWHAQRKATFWYAPEAKRFVKASWRTVAGNWRGPDWESELVSYKPN